MLHPRLDIQRIDLTGVGQPDKHEPHREFPEIYPAAEPDNDGFDTIRMPAGLGWEPERTALPQSPPFVTENAWTRR